MSGNGHDVGALGGDALLDALESGEVRVASRDASGRWIVDTRVKEGILAIFRGSPVVALRLEIPFASVPADANAPSAFVDKAALPPRRFAADAGVRVVPGGSSVRRGAHIGRGVILMPPCFVNVGAYVGAGSMVDSHALVGSCAQIGERVHVSAAAQIGGVIEPAGARPVIVEDDVFVGGNTGLYEGVLVRRRAVIAAGVVLSASTPVFDLVNEREIRGTRSDPLEIPEGAVVVPGSRSVAQKSAFASKHGLNVACALIVKYRDEKTDSATVLEDAIR
ncbi:MAG: 2,3,4,5-tetrahydropyridine-2,6-dicarboxylate N-succinyltransferase [Planctomycetota bacterium]